MSHPSPQCIVNELDWIYMHLDPNPIFREAAVLIKELYIENERLRQGHEFEKPDREYGETATWG